MPRPHLTTAACACVFALLWALAGCGGDISGGDGSGPGGAGPGEGDGEGQRPGATAGDGDGAGPGEGPGGAAGDDGAGPASGEACEPAPHAGASLALTDRQLLATLEALFPFELQLPALPQRARQAHAFSTSAVSNQLTLGQLTRWTEAAESIAAQAHDNLDSLMPCDVVAEGEACLARFVDDFGPRAYRRPLVAEERDGLIALYAGLVADGVDPRVSTSAVIAAVLQSPQFMGQLAVGAPGDATQRFALTGHELASHLAYLLTDAPPDAALRALADDGTLVEPAVLRAEAERLLDDPRGRDVIKRVITEWFDIEGTDYSTRVDPELADAMVEEIERDLDAWLFGDSPLPVSGLLSAQTGMLDGRLAEHYGITDGPSTPGSWEPVELPAHYQGGLLTKALVSARYSSLEEPSIILRGVFVLRELLCNELGTPPLDAVDRNPQLPPEALPREKAEARAQLNPCGSCHSRIDPIGLGMEELDQLGRFRSEYEGGAPVDNAGTVDLLDPPEFTGAAELAQALAGEPLFLECAAAQFSEYALGEPVLANACGPRTLAAEVGGAGTVRELMLALIESQAFLMRDRGAPENSP